MENNNLVPVSTSYLQESKHEIVSDKFQVITPAAIGGALNDAGFHLVSLITGKGRQVDKKDFQRTIARYRSSDAFEINGLHLDLIYISKHLGRGQDELRLGFFRATCANQWNVGTMFEIIKFRHSGNPFADITEGIQRVLAQREQLIEMIKKLQAYQPTPEQVVALAKRFAQHRLVNAKQVHDVDVKSLLLPQRTEDQATDLFTVMNVLQENVVRFPVSYTVNSKDRSGTPYHRPMHTRKLNEASGQLVDLNSNLFDEAMKLVA